MYNKFDQPQSTNEQEQANIDLRTFSEVAQWYIDKNKARAMESKSSTDKEAGKKNARKFLDIKLKIISLLQSSDLSQEGIDKAIDQKIEDFNNKADEAYKSGQDFDKFDRVKKSWEKTQEFIRNQISHHDSEAPAFKEWQQGEVEEPEPDVVPLESSKADGRKIEQLREQLLIDEVFKEGGVSIMTCLPKEYNPKGFQGFTSRLDDRINPNSEDLFMRTSLNTCYQTLGSDHRELKYKNINEAVAISPTKKQVFEEKDVEVNEKKFRGLFSKKRIVKQRVQTGMEAVNHSELVDGGKDEPAYTIKYLVQQVENDLDKNHDSQYYVPDGRGGQTLSLEVVVTESTAKKLLLAIKNNPKMIREMAKQLVVKKFDIPESTWENGDEYTMDHPLRPPYEEWSKKPEGTKMYIQVEGNDGFKGETINLT